jgi:hypothetical protein
VAAGNTDDFAGRIGAASDTRIQNRCSRPHQSGAADSLRKGFTHLLSSLKPALTQRFAAPRSVSGNNPSTHERSGRSTLRSTHGDQAGRNAARLYCLEVLLWAHCCLFRTLLGHCVRPFSLSY